MTQTAADKLPPIVVPDGRGRLALGPYLRYTNYAVDVADNGIVTLTPVRGVILAGTEADNTLDAIDDFIADPSTGSRRELDSPGGWYDSATGLMSGGDPDWQPPTPEGTDTP